MKERKTDEVKQRRDENEEESLESHQLDQKLIRRAVRVRATVRVRVRARAS